MSEDNQDTNISKSASPPKPKVKIISNTYKYLGKSDYDTIRAGELFEKNMVAPQIPNLDERLRKSYGETYLNKASSKKSRRSKKKSDKETKKR